MITLLRHPRRWLIISAATIIVSFIIIFTIKPLWGIDFVGGSLMEITADRTAIPHIRSVLQSQFNISATIQPTQDDSLIIRMGEINEEIHDQILTILQEENLLTGEELRFENIGPTIGQELRRKSLVAIGLVTIIMIVYLTYTFRAARGLTKPWIFGVAAAYALLHDLVLVTALFVIFGRIWGATIDTLFVTAQLAILGYSVNDTIIIFDRMKSEWLRKRQGNLLEVINDALRSTIGRSLNTSFTTLLVLFALLIFGGSTIRWFVVALICGIITGAYSSIFVAPPLLYYLNRRSAHHG